MKLEFNINKEIPKGYKLINVTRKRNKVVATYEETNFNNIDLDHHCLGEYRLLPCKIKKPRKKL